MEGEFYTMKDLLRQSKILLKKKHESKRIANENIGAMRPLNEKSAKKMIFTFNGKNYSDIEGAVNVFLTTLEQRMWPDQSYTVNECNYLIETVFHLLDIRNAKQVMRYNIFLENALRKQKHTLSNPLVNVLLSKSYSHMTSEEPMSFEVLRLVSSVAKYNKIKNDATVENLVRFLCALVTDIELCDENWETSVLCITCLGNIVTGDDIDAKLIKIVYDTTILMLKLSFGKVTEESKGENCHLSMLLSCARTIQILLKESFDQCFACISENFRGFLSNLKSLIFIHILDLTSNGSHSVRMKWQSTDVNTKRQTSMGSDSELSSEGETDRGSSTNTLVKKIRLFSLQILQMIIGRKSKEFLPHWPIFLSGSMYPHADISLSRAQHRMLSMANCSLSTIFLNDKSRRVRYQALLTVKELVEGGKNYIVIAEEPKRGSFTPLSQTIGDLVISLHKALISAAKREVHLGNLLLVLQTLSSFASCTPYNRLNAGLFTDILGLALSFLALGNKSIRLDALNLIGSLFSTTSDVAELKCLLCSKDYKYAHMSLAIGAANESADANLVYRNFENHLLHSLSKEEIDAWKSSPIRSILFYALYKEDGTRNPAVLNALSKIVRSYLGCLEHILSILLLFVRDWVDIKTNDRLFRVQAFRFLEEIANAQTDNICVKKVLWREFIERNILQHFQDEESGVRMSVMTIMAGIDGGVVDEIPEKFIETLVASLGEAQTVSERAQERAVACRAMGKLLEVPAFMARIFAFQSFLSILANFLVVLKRSMRDKNLNVRRQSCWAVANLVNALSAPEFPKASLRDFYDSFFEDICTLLCEAAVDHVKIRFNAARALGNLCSAYDTDRFPISSSQLRRIADALFDNIGSDRYKAQWNALHAVGQYLSVEIRDTEKKYMLDRIKDPICKILESSPNFKVRIGAIGALSKATSLDLLGDYMEELLPLLIGGHKSYTASTSVEFRYIESLREVVMDFLLNILKNIAEREPCAETEKILAILERNGEDLAEIFGDYFNTIHGTETPNRVSEILRVLVFLRENMRSSEVVGRLEVLSGQAHEIRKIFYRMNEEGGEIPDSVPESIPNHYEEPPH